MSTGDLTTLANVKAWISPPITTTTDDNNIIREISAVSREIYNFLQRPTLLSTQYSEIRDGYGNNTIVLRQWPVTSVSLVQSFATVIPAATSVNSPGYIIESWDGQSAGKPQRLITRAYFLAAGLSTISLSYTAGYLVTKEPQSVPPTGSAAFTVTTNRFFAADSGVSYAATGIALTAVTAAPSAGQYVPPTDLGYPYTFSSSDASADVLISYSYIPDDIQQAAIELTILRINERSRIGVTQKSLAGENVTYLKTEMSPSTAAILQPYRKIFPI